jgi:ribosomal protein S1
VDEAAQQIALRLKQLTDDPWSRVSGTYEVGQVRTGRVTRVAEFGAFVELEPGIEALAHVSTFAPGQSGGWSKSVVQGTTRAFEIVSIDPEKKRIGVALVEEGSSKSADVREYLERVDPPQTEGFGSLADKLRGALKTPK